MTIKTLCYIQSVLEESYEKKRLQTKWVKEAWVAAEEKDPDSKECDELHETYLRMRDERDAACDALHEFTNRDWH